MRLFRGIHAINLDTKGRFNVPTRYRQQLSDTAAGQLVVTIDTDERCLLLYPLPTWELIEAKVEALPSFNKSTRRIQRLLLGHATEVELDGSGRILLPTLLREYASIDKKMMLIGQGKKFELWDEAAWQAQREAWLQNESDEDSMPQELSELVL